MSAVVERLRAECRKIGASECEVTAYGWTESGIEKALNLCGDLTPKQRAWILELIDGMIFRNRIMDRF